MTTCPFCEREISEHEAGRCLDAWIRLEFAIPFDKTKESLRQAIIENKKSVRRIFKTLAKHYSTDMNDAEPLWQDTWAIFKRSVMIDHKNEMSWPETVWSIWDKQTLIDWCQNNFDDKYQPITEADTLLLAICHAFLMKEK